jgi:hypothetical protein
VALLEPVVEPALVLEQLEQLEQLEVKSMGLMQ